MCLIAIGFQLIEDCPLVLAANREEFFDRPATLPAIHQATLEDAAPRRYVCGLDQRARGTWLGVNDVGLLIAVTNRYGEPEPLEPRSRGLLCRELLSLANAPQAAERATAELRTGRYAGANFVCLDRSSGFVIHGGSEIQRKELSAGLHLITNRNLNDANDDRQRYFRSLYAKSEVQTVAAFVATTATICGQGPNEEKQRTIIVRIEDRGTVSSSLIAVPCDPRGAIYRYAAGAPDRTPYEDYSPLLQDVLSRDVQASRGD